MFIISKYNAFSRAYNTIAFVSILLFLGCRIDDPLLTPKDDSPSVIIIVWDGIRLSDIMTPEGTFNETLVPFLSNLAKSQNSFVSNRFYHEGYTYTMAGHLALLTGLHLPINNDASGRSPIPTIFHRLISQKQINSDKTWIIATKKKICSLNECQHEDCVDIEAPKGMCNLYGVWGSIDSRAFQAAINVIQNYKPNLLLVSFAAPDVLAHSGDYKAYLKAINKIDEYTAHIYSLITTLYADSIMFIVTTDHGRHDYDYKGHGDKCSGCTSLFILVNFPFQQTIEPPPHINISKPFVHKDIYCWMTRFMSISDSICPN